jgi:hypothetical protein
MSIHDLSTLTDQQLDQILHSLAVMLQISNEGAQHRLIGDEPYKPRLEHPNVDVRST